MKKFFIILSIFFISFSSYAEDKYFGKKTDGASSKTDNYLKSENDQKSRKTSSDKTGEKSLNNIKGGSSEGLKNAGKSPKSANLVFEDIFPKSSELEGGASGWISSDVSKTDGERYVLYQRNYTYYSTQKQRIWDIERNNTYSVSARIFACENMDIASSKYESLSAVDEKITKKKMTAPAPFGERGVLLALPAEGRHADYYITFQLRTFVVQVYSDDGFAQIDMASELEKRISAYLKAEGIDFYMNKINLEVSFEGGHYSEQVNFRGGDISVVVLDGAVFDADNKPVKGAKITARETGQSGVTDVDGKYSIEISSGWGKAIYLSKMIFLPSSSKDKDSFKSGVYPLKVTRGLGVVLEGALDLFIAENKVIGKFLNKDGGSLSPVSGSIQGKKILFAVSCPDSPQSLGRRLIFNGEIGDKGSVKGSISGCGKSGSWELNPSDISIFKEKKYLRDAGIYIANVPVKGEAAGKYFGSARISFTSDALSNPFYFKKGEIALKIRGSILDRGSFFSICEIGSIGIDGEILCRESGKPMVFKIEESKDIIALDVSSYLRSPWEKGYLLSLYGNDGKPRNFKADIENSFAELYYYSGDGVSKSSPVLEAALKTMRGSDVVGNAGKVKADGEGDIVLSLAVSMKGRTLESLEIEGGDGNLTRRWNTNPFDIYPVVSVSKDGKILNFDDGSLKIPLDNDKELFELNIYKGSFGEGGKGSFKIKCVIDGKTYESDEINFK